MCSAHNLPFDFVCQVDSKLVCKDCANTTEHASHTKKLSLADSAASIKT